MPVHSGRRFAANAAAPSCAWWTGPLDRVRVTYEDGGYVVVRSGAQSSNVLSGMALANGLALLPDGNGVAEGDHLDVMLLN